VALLARADADAERYAVPDGSGDRSPSDPVV
jgi:hypothetical protein